ncbi:MAG: PQQ-binding-like beta-propeller repeat protein [Candidatus Bathyarchaeia archaeon]
MLKRRCERKMQKNVKLLIVMASLLAVLAVSALIMPAALAQEPMRVKTFPFINAIPNPVGVNQEVLFHTGILLEHAHGYGWHVEVIIQMPNGTTKIIETTTDSTGGTGVVFVPDQVGVYKVKTHFPEQNITINLFVWEGLKFFPMGTIFEESYSDVLDLIVQEEPVPIYPGHPLPSEYWVRPVDSQLREWNVIGGNWLYGTGPYRNVFAPNNDYAPESPHILWAKTLRGDIGALVGGGGGVGGGEYGEHGYKTGDAYEGEWLNPIIISGVLYYNKYWSALSYDTEIYPGAYSTPPGVVAVDLHTGEVIWERDDIRVSFGQIYEYDSPNQHGAIPYLIEDAGGGTWKFYRASTGRWEFTIENVPSGGYMYYGPNGEIMKVIVDTTNGWMALWNNTHIEWLKGAKYGAGSQMWRPYEITVNGTEGFMWNVSIPTNLGTPGAWVFGLTPYAAYEDRVIGISWNYSLVTVWGLSLKPGEEGTLLFRRTWTPPSAWAEGSVIVHYAGQTNEWKNGVIALFCKEERRFYGFSTEDGRYLWRTEPEHYLNAYGWGPVEHSWFFAYGRLYSTGVSGILYCYDLKTGETLWTYEAVDPYNECLWNKDWWMWICFITDGKVYMGYAEHSPMDPKFRGGPFICVDAITGDEIWRADGMFMQSRWGGRAVIGDSIMATLDHYDSRLYAVGKGPSMVTVEAPSVAVPLGSSLLIRGSVLDVSPGTKDPEIALRFPKGVPAVADENMTYWMRYVYKQFPLDPWAKIDGVWVAFEAIDPEGNYVPIGGTITDGRTGTFSIPWKPDKPGLWTLLLTFPGSKSYYPSYARITVLVEGTPPEAAVQTAIQTMQPLIIVLLVLVIIAIIISVYNIYTIKKKK